MKACQRVVREGDGKQVNSRPEQHRCGREYGGLKAFPMAALNRSPERVIARHSVLPPSGVARSRLESLGGVRFSGEHVL